VENPVGNYTSVVQSQGLETQGFPLIVHMTPVTRLWFLATKNDQRGGPNPQG
jgi:hypothetical protein